jgi:phosphoglycolate phosphatase
VVKTLRGDVRRAALVGDSHIVVEAARNAGVAAWAVPYGYNGGRPIADSKPDRIFASLGELAEHVLAGRSAHGACEGAIGVAGVRSLADHEAA